MTAENLLIIGTVGVGKTTVAEAVGELLAVSGSTHAVIDLDQIRLLWPPPEGDRFNLRSSYAIWPPSRRTTATPAREG